MNYNSLNEIQQLRIALEARIFNSQSELGKISRECKHLNVAKGKLMYSPRQKDIVQTWEDNPRRKELETEDPPCVSMFCQDCGKEFGWYCPVNPKGYCVYERPDGTYDSECIHCRISNERK
jgi:hypothetical protein